MMAIVHLQLHPNQIKIGSFYKLYITNLLVVSVAFILFSMWFDGGVDWLLTPGVKKIVDLFSKWKKNKQTNNLQIEHWTPPE